ncbi:MAG: iron ABC transporter permease [Planctomycetota bacterium]|nr:MAG: iron ABC transporter permease [Planctomycetota bacterium]
MSPAEFSTAVINTLGLIALCAGVAMPVGSTLAILCFRTDVPGRKWLWMLVCSQIAIPLYVFAGGWSAGFGMQGWLRGMGWLPTDWLSPVRLDSPWQNLMAAGLVHALACIPWVALIVGLGIVLVPRSEEEVARTDGGNWFALRHVVLPRSGPWMMLAVLWCVTSVMTEMVVTNLYQVTSLAELVYLDASRGWISYRTWWTGIGVAAILWCIVLIVLRGAGLGRLGQWRIRASGEVWRLGRGRWMWTVGAWGGTLALVGLPLVSLVVKAGWQPVVVDGQPVRYGWSLVRLLTTLRETLVLFTPEYYWSALLAVTSTAVAVGSAVTLYALCPPRMRQWLGLAILMLLAVPGPLVGLLITTGLNRSSPAILGWLYDSTLAAPVLAQQFRLLPIGWIFVVAITSVVGRAVFEQARVDGLTRWELATRVVWPMTWRQWLGAAVCLMIFSVGELSCTILVLPPGVTTVSMRLFEMLHFGMRHQDSGLCGVLVVLGWMAAAVVGKTLSGR